jgi:hypothetical protein
MIRTMKGLKSCHDRRSFGSTAFRVSVTGLMFETSPGMIDTAWSPAFCGNGSRLVQVSHSQ